MDEVVVRRATLKDVPFITWVHCSDLEDDTWYAFPDGKRKEASDPKELTLYERWLNGGSWMSEELCAIYLNNLLLNGHMPLVASIGGTVVGELEVFYGYESDGKLYGHIGVVQVHREYQRQGLGTKLVEKAIEYAKKRGAEYLTVRPRDSLQSFYKKLGFSDWLRTVVFKAEAYPFLTRLSWQEDQSYFNKKRFSQFILGQEQSSAQIWQIFHKNLFALSEFTKEPIHTGKVRSMNHETLAIFFPHVYFGDMANVYAWSERDVTDEHIFSILTLAYHFGYDRVRSLLIEDKFERFKNKLQLGEMERQEILRLDLD